MHHVAACQLPSAAIQAPVSASEATNPKEPSVSLSPIKAFLARQTRRIYEVAIQTHPPKLPPNHSPPPPSTHIKPNTMFGGPAPAQSKAEIKEAEEETNRTLAQVGAAAVLLYFSPFIIDYVKRLV